ncbi:sugar phosphate isomerase/epimerase [Halobacillus litoralis]|uniref:sugar phosphate isomerase/epimerase family protein n=1 Tax=Halobacillus litoralis TaxID=45668 RepID=UPI001CD7A30D|nr:sugar phosphate isomerase/epimerase [Halobacillus litoralis]MCA0971510.1 sugar phosphate isomerase/epimerase [Halobacillus litoralis]
MGNIPVAAQLYTLRNETAQDFKGTLKQVADLGFDGVEFAGFGGHSAEEVKEMLEEFGLQAASSHVPLADLKNRLDDVIQDQHTIGSSFVVCPYIEDRTEEDYHALVEDLKGIAKQCQKEGLTLCYHNHDFELENLSDGRTALQTIFEEVPELETEFDIYWLKKAGEEPVEWLEAYRNRSPLVHLKDMTTDEEQFFAELGTGGVDLKSVEEKGKDIGVKWWIVEQDESRRSPIESLEISMAYIKENFS